MFCKIIEVDGRQVLGRLDAANDSDGCELQMTVESGVMFGTVKLGPFKWDKADEVLNLLFDEDKAKGVLEQIDALTSGEDN